MGSRGLVVTLEACGNLFKKILKTSPDVCDTVLREETNYIISGLVVKYQANSVEILHLQDYSLCVVEI